MMNRYAKGVFVLLIFLVATFQVSSADEISIPSRFGQEIDEILYYTGWFMFIYPEGIWIDLVIFKIPLDVRPEDRIGGFVYDLLEPVTNKKVKFKVDEIFLWRFERGQNLITLREMPQATFDMFTSPTWLGEESSEFTITKNEMQEIKEVINDYWPDVKVVTMPGECSTKYSLIIKLEAKISVKRRPLHLFYLVFIKRGEILEGVLLNSDFEEVNHFRFGVTWH